MFGKRYLNIFLRMFTNHFQIIAMIKSQKVMQIPASVPSIIAFKIILIVSIVIACHYPFFEWAVSDFTADVVGVTHGLA